MFYTGEHFSNTLSKVGLHTKTCTKLVAILQKEFFKESECLTGQLFALCKLENFIDPLDLVVQYVWV